MRRRALEGDPPDGRQQQPSWLWHNRYTGALFPVIFFLVKTDYELSVDELRECREIVDPLGLLKLSYCFFLSRARWVPLGVGWFAYWGWENEAKTYGKRERTVFSRPLKIGLILSAAMLLIYALFLLSRYNDDSFNTILLTRDCENFSGLDNRVCNVVSKVLVNCATVALFLPLATFFVQIALFEVKGPHEAAEEGDTPEENAPAVPQLGQGAGE